MTDFEHLLERLLDHSIEFVLIGGYAAVAHGVSLLTQDIDICLNFSEANLLALQAALQNQHPVHRLTPNRIPVLITTDNAASFKNFYIDCDSGQLDCVSNVDGLGTYEDIVSLSEKIDLDGKPCRILSLTALIRSKEHLGRPRDLEAVKQLKAIQAELGKEDHG